MNFIHAVIDSIFPHACIFCSKVGVDVCLPCLGKINQSTQSICVYCKKESLHGRTHSSCKRGDCLDGLWVLFPYTTPIRTIIHAAKYRNVRGALKDLIYTKGNTRLLLQCKQNIDDLSYLVPIPLSIEKNRQRGYNQAKYLADIFSQILKLPVNESILIRTVDTRAQSKLVSKYQRVTNMQGVFKVDSKLLVDEVVLVDDIWTTGATMLEACKALKQHHVKHVYGLVLAGNVR